MRHGIHIEIKHNKDKRYIFLYRNHHQLQKKVAQFQLAWKLIGLIENNWNTEGNVSLFQEYFEQQICELNFTPIQIVAVYQDGIKLSNSEYEIILPKKIKIKEYVDENIQIEYTHLKA